MVSQRLSGSSYLLRQQIVALLHQEGIFSSVEPVPRYNGSVVRRQGRLKSVHFITVLLQKYSTTVTMSDSASPVTRFTSGNSDHAQGPPRKKMRKGTKSCIECRRRKIKCTFEQNRTSICNECFARGSTCIDQEHGDVSNLVTPPNTSTSKDETNSALKERVSYLEDLVKQVLNRLPEKGTGSPGQSPAAVENTIVQSDTHAGMCTQACCRHYTDYS